MMRYFKKLTFFSIAFSLLFACAYAINVWTEGFSLSQITSSIPDSPKYFVSQMTDEIEDILDQSYRYLGKGCQSYAFASQDGKYVLKFFKHKHLRPLTWLNDIPLLSKKWRSLRQEKIENRQERIDALFSSFKLAFEEMAEESGLLYVHLRRVPATGAQVQLVDKMGMHRKIDLDRFEFVVQKRVKTLKEVLAGCTTEEEIQEKVALLAELVKRRCEKGIADLDRSFAKNVGFCVGEKRAVYIDTGKMVKDASMALPGAFAKDFAKRMHDVSYNLPEYGETISQFMRDYSSSSGPSKEGIESSPSSPKRVESLRKEANFSERASS